MNVVDVQQVSKTFEGQEASLRGTKLEAKGPALWISTASRSLQLTSNQAPPIQALRDVSMHIAPGEVFGLVGRNGSGKTTLIKILAGLIRPTSGTGQVTGIPLDAPQEIRKRVSYVSTTGWMGLEWPLTAEENIRCFATLCGMPASQARQRTAEALRDVEMWENRHKYPSQLSNGMRQRTILARALLFRTPLLLLDEPTVGLDPVTVQTVLELIRGRLRERGQTILLTDHQSTEMEAVADRIAVLEAGQIVMEGTPANLLERLSDLTVIEIHTEEMDLPQSPPPALVASVRHAEPPGALGLRTWRIHARKERDALEEVLRWVTQPSGRIVFLAESLPSFQDLLALAVRPGLVSGTPPTEASGA
jgi:ABC-type multidrug transport system ATPase subunit